jgi:mRNA-degrading endonuclease toxin of MazEF toxin-antitoxin module
VRVLEAASARLLTYDRSGKLIDSTVTSVGDPWGPGGALIRWTSDSMAVTDATQRRVVVLSPRGAVARTISYRAVPSLVWSQVIGIAGNELLFRDIEPLTRIIKQVGFQQPPQPVRAWREGAEVARVIDTLRGEEILATGKIDSAPVFTPIPLGWNDLVAIAGGDLLIARSRSGVLERRSIADSSARRQPVWAFDSVTRPFGLTDRLLVSEYSNTLFEPLNRSEQTIAEQIKIDTRAVPLVDDLRTDRTGAVWVRVTRGDAEPRRTWVKLTPNGESGPTACLVQPFGVAVEAIDHGFGVWWEAVEDKQRRSLVRIGSTTMP